MSYEHLNIEENEVIISSCECGKCHRNAQANQNNIEPPTETTNNYIEVEMRTWKIVYVTNPNNIRISPDDLVICDMERGYDIGKILNTSIKDSELNQQFISEKPITITRIADDNDIANLEKLYEKEHQASQKFNDTLANCSFHMKLIDTIYQLDSGKVTFFFTAESRIDFREFVRELAQIFKTRIELHQCTSRDEAKKLGGYGMCGNEYCCSSFMKRFNQVTIKMAKDQNLSGNLSKISGPCGRLLCCLHFEEDFYAEISKDFPEIGEEIIVENKKMYVFRNDFYAKVVYLTSETQEMSNMKLVDFLKIRKSKKK